MTHHHAAVREPFEKLRKDIRKIRLVAERVGAREGRIGAYAQRRRTAAEAWAEEVEQQSFAVVERAHERQRTPALAHPGVGRIAPGDREQRVAYLWEQLDMLMAVDEIGRAAKVLHERAQLPRDLRCERIRLER